MRSVITFKMEQRSSLIQCPLCFNPQFEGVDALRATLVAVATSLVKCPVCVETVVGLDKLTIHLFGHLADERQVTKKDAVVSGVLAPTDSQQKIAEEIDKRIVRVQNTDLTSIPSCSNEDDLQRNVEELEVIRCDICNFCFTDKTILDMHQKLLHQTSPDKKGVYSYHCHLCSKKFKMRGSLKVHLRVAHYGFWSNNADNTESNNETVDSTRKRQDEIKIGEKSQNTQTKLKVLDNKQWECDVCAKMFTTKYFLKKHKRLHTGEMPYTCNLCDKSFTFQQSYHKHMLYHSSEKPYSCSECGRPFKELSTLQNHVRIHSGERPFSCETCGKCFRQRVSYLVHRRIHTGAMPYQCTACDKRFRYKISQRSHKCSVSPPGCVVRISDETKEDYIQRRSIVLNNNEQIEISFNEIDLQLAMEATKLDLPEKSVTVIEEDDLPCSSQSARNRNLETNMKSHHL